MLREIIVTVIAINHSPRRRTYCRDAPVITYGHRRYTYAYVIKTHDTDDEEVEKYRQKQYGAKLHVVELHICPL